MIDNKKHAERMTEILKRTPEGCKNILCYISGYMSNSEEFEEAFRAALIQGFHVE
jgi:hypothetical protein